MNSNLQVAPSNFRKKCDTASKINVTLKCARLSEKLQHCVMKLTYVIEQVNLLQLKSSVTWKWANTFGGNIYFAGDGTYNSIFTMTSDLILYVN